MIFPTKSVKLIDDFEIMNPQEAEEQRKDLQDPTQIKKILSMLDNLSQAIKRKEDASRDAIRILEEQSA